MDARSEEVTEVLVDDGPMRQPTLVLRADGGAVTERERDRVAWITPCSERPRGDDGSVRHGPDVRRVTGGDDG